MLANQETTYPTVRCSRDAHVEMDMWPDKKGPGQNNDIRERVGVAPIEEKLVQHRLRWFGYIQRKPWGALVHNRRIKHAENVKKGCGRS